MHLRCFTPFMFCVYLCVCRSLECLQSAHKVVPLLDSSGECTPLDPERTLRKATSWPRISCSTSRMVCDRAAIPSLSSCTCRRISESFSARSALRAESLASSCSCRKRRRTSNSSLMRSSVCWVWFWLERSDSVRQSVHTLGCVDEAARRRYLHVLSHVFAQLLGLLVLLQLVPQRLQRILQLLL